MLRKLPLGLLAAAIVALSLFLATAPTSGSGKVEAAGLPPTPTLSASPDPGCVFIAGAAGVLQAFCTPGTDCSFSQVCFGFCTVLSNCVGNCASLIGSCLGGCGSLLGGSLGGSLGGCLGGCSSVLSFCGSSCLGALNCLGSTCALTASCIGNVCGVNSSCLSTVCGINADCFGSLGLGGFGLGGFGLGGFGLGGFGLGGFGLGGIIIGPNLVNPLPVAQLIFAKFPIDGTCGSFSDINLTAVAANGQPAADNSSIGFTSTLGSITKVGVTDDGQVLARLVVDPHVRGTAIITATAANGVSAQKTMNFTCAS
jgi:hypothetical protein